MSGPKGSHNIPSILKAIGSPPCGVPIRTSTWHIVPTVYIRTCLELSHKNLQFEQKVHILTDHWKYSVCVRAVLIGLVVNILSLTPPKAKKIIWKNYDHVHFYSSTMCNYFMKGIHFFCNIYSWIFDTKKTHMFAALFYNEEKPIYFFWKSEKHEILVQNNNFKNVI